MRLLLGFCLVLVFTACNTAKTTARASENDAATHQAELNATYLDANRSILPPEKLAKLQKLGGLPFYSIDPAYRVTAKLERFEAPEVIKMQTSSTRLAEYAIYALATFELNGKAVSIPLYRSLRIDIAPKYRNLLFLPFKDHTSGKTTYGGGRYLDLSIPDGDELVIDFNKAYHPYCAYTTGYSCPVVPEDNYLDMAVEAGIKMVDLEEQ
ncbi:DUF1684 domain-containing protein [Neolewinella persica]|uniref:DUF1684 domain-containing protein n=1 Tax=Neolewinella persica TaxID=70998 RepID=UPI00035C4A69|nr:DUF1684 domain-containing protein [Neolewinella persica]